MKKVVTVQEAIAAISFAYLLIKTTNHLFMEMCDQAPLWLPKIQNHQLLTIRWRSFSGWGWERLSTCLLYKGCQYIRKWHCSTIVNILQLPVGYLNVTINGKPETQNQRLDPTGLAKPGETGRWMGMGPGLAGLEAACRVFGPLWNRTEPFFQ